MDSRKKIGMWRYLGTLLIVGMILIGLVAIIQELWIFFGN